MTTLTSFALGISIRERQKDLDNKLGVGVGGSLSIGSDVWTHRVGLCSDRHLSCHLAGLAAESLLDQPLAERPQGAGGLLPLSLGGRQATAAVVEIHPSQAL